MVKVSWVRRICFITIVTLCVFQFLVDNGTSLQSNSSDVLVVGLDRDFAPHEWWSDGTAKGFNPDIIRAVARILHKEIVWVPLEWQHALESLQNGTVDVLFMSASSERNLDFDFSQPILNLSLRIFVRDEVSGIMSIDDLSGHTVAVQAGDIAYSKLQELNPNATIVQVDTQEDAIKLVSEGEVMAAFCNQYAGAFAVLNNSITNVKMIGAPVAIGFRVIAVAKGNTILLDQINYALSVMKKSGEFDQILKQWFGEYLFSNNNSELLQAFELARVGLFVSFVGAIVVFAWNWSLRIKVENTTRQIKLLSDIFKHDLRNIGQGLYTSLEILNENMSQSPLECEMVEVALAEVERAIDLVSDYSKIELLSTGRVKLIAIDLSSMLKSVEKRVKEQFPSVVINASYMHPNGTSIQAVESIEEGFYRILCFLISSNNNKVNSSTISIQTKLKGKYVLISIISREVGISDDIKKELMKQHMGIHTSQIGLNLSLIHAIIVTSKGKIDVKDLLVGQWRKGVIFNVYLRKA